jgi:molecular chaperone HtpG
VQGASFQIGLDEERMTAHAETLEFRTELKQLLHLITHSLYSNKEIFLRELISNASDAINKIKFDSLQHEEQLEGNKDWKIRIAVDREKRTLTVSDNGIGLSRQSAIENLGTIAHSGTRAFLERLKSAEGQTTPDLIGQFGVGFYSAFMVADKVTVISRPAGDPKEGVRWESDGQGAFSVEAVEKPTRGTDVILHLKPDEDEFLNAHQLRSIVKKFSDFIEHPVVMDVEKEEEEGKKTTVEETLNARKALWLRQKSENTPEEYKEFYQQISSNYDEPAKVIHYATEGRQEFRVLLFIPSHQPFELRWQNAKWGPRLYVQRVLIMEHCEALLPSYLRFITGVVDSSNLSLNISRELLQQNPLLEQIRTSVVKAVLKGLNELKSDEYDKYVNFFKEMGSYLKEGPAQDWENREKIADLFLFESMKTEPGKYITLEKYVEAMPEDQKEIWYLIGEERDQLEHSPYLEELRAKGQDVLLMTDPVDEFMVPRLREYKGRHFRAADRVESSKDKPETPANLVKLFEYLKSKLPEVTDVRLSTRLRESASCLVSTEMGASAHLERLLQRAGRGNELMGSQRILELNGEHAVIGAMASLLEKNADDPRLESFAHLIYDQAVIAEGSKVKDPVAFARRINELLVKGAS